jgi:hypothetical protein
MAVKLRNEGAVKQDRKVASRAANEGGMVGVGIGDLSLHG